MSSPPPAAAARESRRVLETPNLLLRAAHANDSAALSPIFSDAQVMRYWSEPPHPSLKRTKEWVDGMTQSSQNGITDFIITLKHPASPRSTTSAATTTTCNNTAVTEEPGDAIGKIGIYAAWPSNEIGFLLSRAHWGRGLAHEALTCILGYLFRLPACSSGVEAESEALGSGSEAEAEAEAGNEAHRLTTLSTHERRDRSWRYASITTDVDPRNVACLRLLRRVGFAESGFVERTYCVGGVEWVDSVFLRLGREEWLRGIEKGKEVDMDMDMRTGTMMTTEEDESRGE